MMSLGHLGIVKFIPSITLLSEHVGADEPSILARCNQEHKQSIALRRKHKLLVY